MANHLTPSELADEMNMKRRDVISKCMEMNVPIFNGRIDKTLFLSNLRQFGKGAGSSASRRLAAGGTQVAFLRAPRRPESFRLSERETK